MAMLNDRDVLIQNTVPRITNVGDDKVLLLSVDSPVFHVSNTAVGSPAVLNFKANLINISGTVNWSCVGGALVTNGINATLAYADMTANTATITASLTLVGKTYTAIQVVSKVFDGANGTSGSNGTSGTSARVAYTLINSTTLNSTPSSANIAGDNLPATGTWGETNAWTTSAGVPVAGQSVFVSNGLYNPATDTTTWRLPYLATLKVGSLSILTPNLGNITQGALNINNNFVVLADGTTTIQSTNAGAGYTVTKNTGMRVYYPGGTIAVKIGDLS